MKAGRSHSYKHNSLQAHYLQCLPFTILFPVVNTVKNAHQSPIKLNTDSKKQKWTPINIANPDTVKSYALHASKATSINDINNKSIPISKRNKTTHVISSKKITFYTVIKGDNKHFKKEWIYIIILFFNKVVMDNISKVLSITPSTFGCKTDKRRTIWSPSFWSLSKWYW